MISRHERRVNLPRAHETREPSDLLEGRELPNGPPHMARQKSRRLLEDLLLPKPRPASLRNEPRKPRIPFCSKEFGVRPLHANPCFPTTAPCQPTQNGTPVTQLRPSQFRWDSSAATTARGDARRSRRAPPRFQGLMNSSHSDLDPTMPWEARVCLCDDPIGQCIPAGCKTSEDCPDSACVGASYTSSGCPSQPQFQCVREADQCLKDSDCPSYGICEWGRDGERVCESRHC